MKENRNCYILRGPSGSGKSTHAKTLENESTKICSADYFWLDSNGFYNFDSNKLSEAHKSCFEDFKKFVNAGFNVVIDNTNIKYSDFTKYIDYLILNNNQNNFIYSVELIEICYNDLETAIKYRKNNSDGKNVPESKIKAMFKNFKKDVKGMILRDYKGKISLGSLDELSTELPWQRYENEKYLSSKIPAIICDLDGTLSIFEYTNGIQLRDCYDASTCDSDIICEPVAKVLQAMYYSGTKLIFVSGREEIYRKPTEDFLKRFCELYGVKYQNLFMRKEKDCRKDFIIKEEIFENEIKDQFSIIAVFDDRKSVVSMWRTKGIYVFDCNYRGMDF